ncbi:MAG: hypothetical protein KKF78_04250 [Candidatus Omnitrophica bacterium]|nr:hypothetical protein [Candidatus Omnitrophota bacterium]
MNIKKTLAFTGLSILCIILLAVILTCLLELALYFRAPYRFFKRPTIRTRIKELFDNEIGNCFVQDKKLPFKLKSNCSKTIVRNNKLSINSHGYRGKEFSLKKDPNTFRILFVGDSFTFGFALDDNSTIPQLLENRLKDKFGNIEVINAGFHGSNPMQFDLFLRTEGYSLDPDMIILLLLADNDMLDITYNIIRKIDIDGLPTKITDGMLNYQGYRYNHIMPAWMYRMPPIMDSRACYWFLDKVNGGLKQLKKRYKYTYDNLENFFERPVLGIINDSKKRNVLIRPWLIIGGEIIRGEEGKDNKYYKSMRMFFERNDIEYLDLGTELLKYSNKDVCYKRLSGSYDGHLNEKGNQISAELGTEDILPIIRKQINKGSKK